MSRLLRALGLGGGGDGPAPAAGGAGGARGGDSPKVRRLRETMRWRGYDLSAYSDEQIAAVSARFPNDISDDGETTEDGRRALAEALERGEFAAPTPVPSAPTPPPSASAAPEPSRRAASARAEAPSASWRTGVGMPTVGERLLHVFGVHSWRRLQGDEGVSMRCVGCGRLRSAPAPFEPPAAPPPPPEEEDAPPVFRRVEPPPDPVERDPDPVAPFDIPRRQAGERPGQRPQQPESPWQFFLGLPWWSKLLAVFILVQVISFIVQRIG